MRDQYTEPGIKLSWISQRKSYPHIIVALILFAIMEGAGIPPAGLQKTK